MQMALVVVSASSYNCGTQQGRKGEENETIEKAEFLAFTLSLGCNSILIYISITSVHIFSSSYLYMLPLTRFEPVTTTNKMIPVKIKFCLFTKQSKF